LPDHESLWVPSRHAVCWHSYHANFVARRYLPAVALFLAFGVTAYLT
jgi:hypothetical protein